MVVVFDSLCLRVCIWRHRAVEITIIDLEVTYGCTSYITIPFSEVLFGMFRKIATWIRVKNRDYFKVI